MLVLLSTKSFNVTVGVRSIKLNKNPVVLNLNLKYQAEFIVSIIFRKKKNSNNKMFLGSVTEKTQKQ